MAAGQSWVNELRAETLATIVLTRHDGIDVIPIARYAAKPDFDLLVRIDQGGASGAMEFGVVTWGVRGPVARAKRTLRVQVDPDRIERTALPVLLVVFDVDSEEGSFVWLNEPSILPDGTAGLRPMGRLFPAPDADHRIAVHWTDLRRLDDATVDEIVDRVSAWYAKRERPVLKFEAHLVTP
jgi:hypothetical protein